MAEAIGVAGSIAGLVQIAGGLFRLAFRFITDVKEAKSHIKALVDELQILAGILHRLNLLVATLEVQDHNTQNILLLRQIRSCRQTLSQIEKPLLAACQTFESNNKVTKWKHQLKWPFDKEETKELLSELNRHKETLNLALTADSVSTLLRLLSDQKDLNKIVRTTNHIAREHMDVTTRIVADQNRLKILQYFMKWDPQPTFTQALQEHHPSTGLWLIDSEEITQWIEIPGSKIWLTGIPGAGKTVMAAAMLENVIQQDSDLTGVAFFFCTYSEPKSHDAINMLSTFAAQLARQSKDAFNILQDYYEELHPENKLSRPIDIARLTTLLSSIFKTFSHVLVVVDGLDECNENVLDVLVALAGLTHDESSLSLALFSRDEHEIRGFLTPEFKSIEIAAHKEDLQQYTASEIENRLRTRQLRLKTPSLKDKIIIALVDGADGMFRWVTCQIDHLCRLHNDKARQKALKSLPPGLTVTYERILNRIESFNEQACLLVQRALLLITFASPRLTIPELCGALATCDEIDELDKDVEIDEEEIAYQCTSLIRRSANGRSFELAHFTVKEFLQQKVLGNPKFVRYHLEESRAHFLLLECSLRFLLLKNFARHPRETTEEENFIMKRNEVYPFYEYASMSIPSLARVSTTPPNATLLIGRLFESRKSSNFTSWSLELLRHYRHGSWDSWIRSRASSEVARRGGPSKYAMNADLNHDTASGRDDCGSKLHLDESGTGADSSSHMPYRRYSPEQTSKDGAKVYLGGPLCHSATLSDLVFKIRHSSFRTLHMASLLGFSSVCQKILAIDQTQVNGCSKIGTPLICALGGPFILSSYGLSEIHDSVAIFERPCMATIEVLMDFGADCSAKMEATVGTLNIPLLALIVSNLLDDLRMFDRIMREKPSMNEILDFLIPPFGQPRSPLLQTIEDSLETNLTRVLGIMESVIVHVKDDKQKHPIYERIIEQLRSRLPIVEQQTPSYRPITSGDLRKNLELAIRYDDAEWMSYLLSSSEEGIATSNDEWLVQSAFDERAEAVFKFILTKGLCRKLQGDAANALLLSCYTSDMTGFLKCLLESGLAGGRPTDRSGNTIYHLAAKEGSQEILNCLFDCGSDAAKPHPLQMMNQDERTPLAEALLHEQDACAVIIVRSCNFEKTDKSILRCSSPSLYSLVANVKSPRTIQILAQADLLPSVEHGSPLHLADWFSRPDVLHCLLTIYPYTQGPYGKTPLEILWDWCLAERSLRLPSPNIRKDTLQLLSQHELSYTSRNPTSRGLWWKFAKRLRSKSDILVSDAVEMFTVAEHTGAIAAYEANAHKNAISEFEPLFASITKRCDSPAVEALLVPILESSTHLEWFETESAIQALRWSVLIGSTTNVQYLLPRVLDKTDPEKMNGLLPTGEGLGLLHLASSCAFPLDRSRLYYPLDRGALYHAAEQVFEVPWPQRSEHWMSSGNPFAPRGRVLRELYGLPILSSQAIEAEYAQYTQPRSSMARQETTLHEVLLDFGLDPNLRSRESRVLPLSMYLCMNAPLAVLKILVRYSARYDAGSADKYGWTPVAWACLLGRLDFLQYITNTKNESDLWGWKADARVHFRGAQSTVEFVHCTALHLAIMSRDIKVVDFVLNHVKSGISHLHGDSEQCTPLHLALQQEDITVTELSNMLIRHGADINAPGPHKWSPLHGAAQNGDNKTMSTLIDNGAVRATDRYGRSPIYYALEANSYSVIPVLAASATADLSLKSTTNAELQNAMAHAFREFIRNNDLDACQSLINAGCPLEIKLPPCHKCTPLLLALWCEKTAIVNLLLRKGADVHCTACQELNDWQGDVIESRSGVIVKRNHPSMTPLDMMLRVDTFSEFLPQWLSSLSESQFRWLARNSTAAHVAVARSSTASLKILLSHAAGLKDELGLKLSKYLVNVPFPEYPRTDDILYRTQYSRVTPLNRAISMRNVEAAKTLIDYGADTSVISQQCAKSALHYAAYRGSQEILEFILSSSHLINAPSRTGVSALFLAILEQRDRCAKSLLEHGAFVQPSIDVLVRVSCFIVNRRAFELFLDRDYKACSKYTWTISKVVVHVFSYKVGPSTTRRSDIVMGNLSNLMEIPVAWIKSQWINYCVKLTREGAMYWDVRGLGLSTKGARLLFERIEAPDGSFSALCWAATFDLLPVVEGLLKAGFDENFIDADLGSPLMAALRTGQREVVKFLVRYGCSLAGIGEIWEIVPAHFPDIVDWLLVQRFTEQDRLTASDEDKEPQIEQPWSGSVKLRFPLFGNHRQEWEETDFEYTIFLHRLRQEITNGGGIHSSAALANQPRWAVVVTGHETPDDSSDVSNNITEDDSEEDREEDFGGDSEATSEEESEYDSEEDLGEGFDRNSDNDTEWVPRSVGFHARLGTLYE